MLRAAHLTLFHTIETQEESTVHHAFSTTCRASLFSAGRVTFFVLAALLLCVNVCLPAPALAAIYNGGVSNGGITDIPLVDTGSNGANDVPASSDDLVMLHSLDISGTTLRACAIAVGTTDADLLASKELEVSVLASTAEVFIEAAQEDRVLLTLDWDLSTLDTSEAGFNLLVARATLPEGYCWKDGSTQIGFTKPVSVQTPNKPLLDTHYDASSHLMFPWVVPTEFDKTAIRAYLSSSTDEWKDVEDEDLGFVQNDGLFLYSNELSSGTIYRVRIEYPQGYAETGFLFESGNALIIDTVSGDRDGGDGNGNGPAAGEQPLPDGSLGITSPSTGDEDGSPTNQEQGNAVQTPGTASPLPSSANNTNSVQPLGQHTLERYSAHETTVSGTRLTDLCTGSTTVSFDQNGVVIGLPSAFLLSLGLASSDTLSVYATTLGSSTLMVALAVNGWAISEAPGMTVRLPYDQQDQNAALTVLDEGGSIVSQGTLSGSSLSFATDKPGTFRIVEGNGTASGDASEESTERQATEPTGVAYGATLGGADTKEKSVEGSVLSMAVALCALGALAAAGGFGTLAFLRKRA